MYMLQDVGIVCEIRSPKVGVHEQYTLTVRLCVLLIFPSSQFTIKQIMIKDVLQKLTRLKKTGK